MSYKYRLETDPYNRVVVRSTSNKSGLRRFRKVIDGRFKLDRSNQLTYKLRSPVYDLDLPHQLTIKGKWSLTKDHDLRLSLDKKGRDTLGDKITLKGQIIDARKNSLLFAVSSKTHDDRPLVYVLELRGVWQADDRNRLTFKVNKERGASDVLTFRNAWEIDRSKRIVYIYEKSSSARKSRKVHSLTFKGHWKTSDISRISYELSSRSDSRFTFATDAAILKGNRIDLQAGVRISKRGKPEERIITLFGKWRLVKDLGLVFEARYKDHKKSSIVFGADARLSGSDSLSFRLRSDKRKDGLGAELSISRKILKSDGEAFLRLLSDGLEHSFYAGAAWKW